MMTASDCSYTGSGFETIVRETEQDTLKWSPDGSQIVFPYARNLFAVESDGSRIRRLTGTKDQTVMKYSKLNVSPDISPDGSQVAYTNFEEPHFNIKTVKLKRWFKRKRTLAKIDGNDIYPVWSPDGSRFTVKGPTRLRGSETLLLSGPSKVKGAVVLATMDPDGENVQVLVRVGFSDLVAEGDWVEPESDSGMNTGRGP